MIYFKVITAIVTFIICLAFFVMGIYGFYDSNLLFGLSGLLLGSSMSYFVYVDYKSIFDSSSSE